MVFLKGYHLVKNKITDTSFNFNLETSRKKIVIVFRDIFRIQPKIYDGDFLEFFYYYYYYYYYFIIITIILLLLLFSLLFYQN